MQLNNYKYLSCLMGKKCSDNLSFVFKKNSINAKVLFLLIKQETNHVQMYSVRPPFSRVCEKNNRHRRQTQNVIQTEKTP